MSPRKPNMESSIYLGSDGWWHGRVTMGVKDNGRPDRRHRRAKTETEVKRRVRELEALRDKGQARHLHRNPRLRPQLRPGTAARPAPVAAVASAKNKSPRSTASES